MCADKFQTGYDEPLLHTMYVDKPLSGVKAVQTLSRLNRAHPKKHDAFVLDFANDVDTIQTGFAPYYRTTILAEETDPDRLHDLKAALDGYQVYDPAQVDDLVERYLSGADRDRLDPILDACVSVYREQLDEDGQVDFKGKAKAFLRAYGGPGQHLALYLRRVGEALDLPDLPRSQAACACRGTTCPRAFSKQSTWTATVWRSRPCRHPTPRRGCGDRTGPNRRRRAEAGTGDRPALQHSQEFNDRFGNIEWKDQDKIDSLVKTRFEEVPAI